jgi:phosphatidylserine decarboxylase
MTDLVDAGVKAPWLRRLGAQEDLNFLLTNRVPRLLLTRLMGRVGRIESPRFTRLAIAVWRLFTDLDLSEAKKTRFDSIHDCFTRELRDGARPVDPRPDVLASPCDAIVGACGGVARGQVFQAKGMPYALPELLGPAHDAEAFEGGAYATLRLTSAMYHRFHAPCDLTVEHVSHFRGDAWNVNPAALQRIERLFCRNERAVLRARLDAGGATIAIVPVAAILVAGLRLHFLDLRRTLRERGLAETPCAARVARGQELGWFEHGSTIIVFAPRGFALAEGVSPGSRLRMGQALMRRAAPVPAAAVAVPDEGPAAQARRVRCGR